MLDQIRQNPSFVAKAEKAITRAQDGTMDVKAAVDKFHRTQRILMEAMEEGDLSVASAVIKSHEMEYRMHGLFEKDNKQKGSAVQINISLHEEPEINKVEDLDAT